MPDEELINKIKNIAYEHDGKYLLPRRYKIDEYPKTNVDLEYDACQILVDRFEARWLSGDIAPGIIMRRPK